MDSAIFKILGLTPQRETEIKKFILIFYCIGITGMLIPYTFPFFKTLTPYALLLMAVLLAAYHRGKANVRSLIIFSAILLLGFVTEAIGVNKGILFGRYNYGKGLGLKVLNTPVIIGLNWWLLTYVTASIFENYKIKSLYKIIFASISMLAYDIILEQIAPKLDLWYWENNRIPLKNYVAWLIIAIIFQLFIRIFRINTLNNLSVYIYFSQFVFFIVLLFFLK